MGEVGQELEQLQGSRGDREEEDPADRADDEWQIASFHQPFQVRVTEFWKS